MLRWSLKLGHLAGIPVYVHWTFFLLIIWLLFVFGRVSMEAAVIGIAFVLTLFGCVVFHELGHALAARRYGVQTRDITLLPIGGMARLQRMPDKPLQELVVAVAGPAVNVVIAGVLLAVLLPWVGWQGLAINFEALYQPAEPLSVAFAATFLAHLMWINVILVVFNMLPAFPMDGGRALRALLATQISYLQATNISAAFGQGIAVLFGLLAIFTFNPILLFIALFVFLGADAEARFAHVRTMLQGVPVRDAMLTHFRTLTVNDTLDTAVEALLSDPQQDFPVLDDYGQLRGILYGDDLIKKLRDGERGLTVGEMLRTECSTIDDREMLDRVLQQMQEGSCSTLPVLHDGKLAGMITMDNLSHFMTIRSALRRPGAPAHQRDLNRAA